MSVKKIKIFILFIVIFVSGQNIVLANEAESQAAVVICEDTGRILYGKNENEKMKMASLTKLMTAIILVENCKLDETITVDSAACLIGGSTAGLNENDTVTVEDLLYAMLLPSGNDAAIAVAYHVAGDVKNFVELMNKKAKDLGLTNTHFDNPHGLDSDSHYTTAYEMALISKYAKSYDIIEKVVNTSEYTVTFSNRQVALNNTNRLLRTYSKATGMKTGFTNGANRCLVASATDENLNLIAVVLGAQSSDIRFNDAQMILEETFKNYTYYDLSSFLNVYIDIPIIKGKDERYIYTYSDEKYEALTTEEYSRLYVSQNFITSITAPARAGTYIGTYSLLLDDEIIYSKDFYLEEDILKKNTWDYFIEILTNMFEKMEVI